MRGHRGKELRRLRRVGTVAASGRAQVTMDIHRPDLARQRKRRRVILAGADLVIPDFSVAPRLLTMLGIAG